MRLSRSVLAALAVSALVASACGATSDTTTESGASVPDTASVATEQPVDLEAVFVPTAAGGQLDFNTLRGQDVLLWFWAPW